MKIITGNETAIISASAALIGVFLTVLANLFQKWLDMRHAKNMKKLEFAIEFEKNHLLEPILSFIDSDLATLREVYALGFINKEDWDKVKIKSEHLNALPSVSARVKGLGDEIIYNKFNEFTRKRILIGNAINSDEKDSFKELESAIELAGEIMYLLFERAKKIKS